MKASKSSLKKKTTFFYIVEIVFALIFLVGFLTEFKRLSLIGGFGVIVAGLIFKFFVITE